MTSLSLYIITLLVAIFYVTIVYAIACIKKNNSIMDTAYGIGFIVTSATLAYFYLSNIGQLSSYSVAMFLLITIWGIRLARRIYKKNKNKPEDFRYAHFRELWSKKGKQYFLIRSYIQLFLLQAVIISLVLLPFTLSLAGGPRDRLWLTVGFLIWIIGFYFESRADKELDTFIKHKHTNAHKILKTGLWKYSRHPNYFGESMMWLGLACMSIGTVFNMLPFISPILITYLLLFVSGVPMVEKKMKGDFEWEEYKKKTSVFFPMKPKHG